MPPNAALRRRSRKSFPALPTLSMRSPRRHKPRIGSSARRSGSRLRRVSGRSSGRSRHFVRSLNQIALRVAENHGAYCLVIFDVTGTAAEMAVEGLRDGFFEIGAQRGLFCQTLQQDLSLVQKARGAITALEREVFDETLLQRREFACLGMALDGSDRLPVKADCGHWDFSLSLHGRCLRGS